MVAAQLKTIMALDVGDKRIGVAIASVLARLPGPLTTVVNDQHVFDELSKLIKDHDVVALVVGLPRGLEGQETAQTVSVRQFIEQLKSKFTLPIHLQDEALTSKQAEAELAAKKRYNKEDVDALAATLILQDFLVEHQETIA